jgi:hypothetical protein
MKRYIFPLDGLKVIQGKAGDFGVHDALLITDRNGQVIDRLLVSQFRKKDIEALHSVLASVVNSPATLERDA